jgi:hypothetical protein
MQARTRGSRTVAAKRLRHWLQCGSGTVADAVTREGCVYIETGGSTSGGLHTFRDRVYADADICRSTLKHAE